MAFALGTDATDDWAKPLAWIAHLENKDDEAIRMLRALEQKEIDGMTPGR